MNGLPGVPGPCPGLLTCWTRHGGQWLGRVYAVVDDGQVVLVEAWVAAGHLSRQGEGPGGRDTSPSSGHG